MRHGGRLRRSACLPWRVVSGLVGASLSFLGLGIQPPTPDLGTMVSQGAAFLPDYWWESVLPGFAILFVALGFNLLGDGLRDLFDVQEVR